MLKIKRSYKFFAGFLRVSEADLEVYQTTV